MMICVVNFWVLVISSSSSFVFLSIILTSFFFEMLIWRARCERVFESIIFWISIVFWICVQTNLNWEKRMMSSDWIVLDLRKDAFMMTILTMMNLITSASFESLNNMICRTNKRLNENVENYSLIFLFFTCLSIWKESSTSEKFSIIIVFFCQNFLYLQRF